VVRISVIVFAACVLGMAAAPPSPVAEPPLAAPMPAPASPPASEAEQIAELQRSIAADQQQLAQLQAALEDPRHEYAKAETEFERVDTQLRQKLKAQQALQTAGKTDRVQLLAAEVAALQPTWKLAKQRFELVIAHR
jgi:septal ring factor EnvC (AmiA/AmiB activator)